MIVGQSKRTCLKQEQNAMSDSLKELNKIFSSPKDIHKFTPTIGRLSTLFYQIDQKYKLSSLEHFNAVEKEILNYAHYDNRVVKVLNTIKNNQGKTERETGINVAELLVRSWNLAKKPGNFKNSQKSVIDCLKENINARGGCLAGISARLLMPYAHFVHHLLKQPTPHHQHQGNNEQALIDKAIAASLKDVRPPQKKPRNKEQELIDKAIAASLADIPDQDQELFDEAIAAAIAASFIDETPMIEDQDLDQAIAASLAEPDDLLQQYRLKRNQDFLDREIAEAEKQRLDQEALDEAIARSLVYKNN